MATKTKQTWWKALSPEQQDKYIKKRTDSKAARRRARSIATMKQNGLSYNCNECVHGKTRSCTDNLLNGCEYYFESN